MSLSNEARHGEINSSNIEWPTSTVSAVTRKKNEIFDSLRRGEDRAKIEDELQALKQKIELFDDKCQAEIKRHSGNVVLQTKVTQYHLQKIATMRSDFDKAQSWLFRSTKVETQERDKKETKPDAEEIHVEEADVEDPGEDDIQPIDSVSNATSKGSCNSSMSSIRAKALQAKLLAEKNKQYYSQEKKVEEKIRRLKQQREVEELQRRQRMEDEDAACLDALRDLQLKKDYEVAVALEQGLNGHGPGSVYSKSPQKVGFLPSRAYINQQIPPEDLGAVLSPDAPPFICSPTRLPTSIQSSPSALNEILLQSVEKQNNISAALMARQAASFLPKHEPSVFDGKDITAFREWLMDFEHMIVKNCGNNPDDLFYYLCKYTDGRPKQVVIALKSPHLFQSYQNAISKLKEIYDDEIQLTRVYLERIRKWPRVELESGECLREFHLQLLKLKNNLSSLNNCSILDKEDRLLELVTKLPDALKRAWRERAHRLYQQGQCATFNDFVGFVEYQNSLLNTPIFGNIIRHEKISSVARGRSFTTSNPERKQSKYNANNQNYNTCKFCNRQNHLIGNCRDFLELAQKDRVQKIKVLRLCFGCLRSGHGAATCMAKLRCKFCSKKHPSCLHYDKLDSNEKREPDGAPSAPEVLEVQPVTEETATCKSTWDSSSCQGKRILCACVPVLVTSRKSDKAVKTYLGLDSHSTDSFMDVSLAKELDFQGRKTHLALTTMENKRSNILVEILNNVKISDLQGNNSVLLPRVYAKDNWPFSLADSPSYADLEGYPHLKNLPFKFIKEKIGILVGANMVDLLAPLDVALGRSGEPFATLHLFGWALNGPTGSSPVGRGSLCNRAKTRQLPDIEEKIEKLYEADFNEPNSETLGLSIEDQKWLNRVESSMKRTEAGHYEIGLPFREETVVLPNNYSQALGRIESLRRRFEKNAEFFSKYSEFMTQTVIAGFAHPVPESEKVGNPGKIWYLTHHGVFHKVKKSIRVVFDCALKFKNISLNDRLLQGPDLANSLIGVLLRFRQGHVAFQSDIAKMFYQVKVSPEDQDFLRFLWFPDGDLSKDPTPFRLSVHVFGAVSSPSCANFALRRVTRDVTNLSERVKDTILRNFYVDDCLKSLDHEDEVIQLISELVKLLKSAGFNLTGFVSNSRKVLSSIPSTDLAKGLKTVDLAAEELPKERALGVVWRVESDKLSFEIKDSAQPFTRRGMLSVVAGLYDPLGFATPVIVLAKSLFQESCRRKLSWDQGLPPDLLQSWKDWIKDLKLLNSFEVPRSYKPSFEIGHVSLHTFADGSEKAYGAVSYIRFEGLFGEAHCALVMAKSRLAPMNNKALKTIPRIELSAAKLAVILAEILKRELELGIDDYVWWSDSTTVLKYISSESTRFQRFVSNRVAFILSKTSVEQWKFVPGNLNPADVVSRGSSIKDFIPNNTWRNGPEFLWKPKSEWPQSPDLGGAPLDPLEIKKSEKEGVARSLHTSRDPIMDLLSASSDWTKAKRRIAWLLRLKRDLARKCWTKGPLKPLDLEEAERVIWRFIQQKAYQTQINSLQKHGQVSKGDQLVRLKPFIGKDVLLRVGGRQGDSKAPYDSRHPIILPRDVYLVELLVQFIHRRVGHLGRETTLAKLRETYWIVGGNALVRSLLRKCSLCRRIHGKASEQIMADLPTDRVTGDLPAFANCGVDIFGPLEIRRNRRNKITEKRYGAVFTCLASRAIHLEVVYSLSLDSFICALRRFVARRGVVKSIRSDNGTNFVGANRELKEAIGEWNSAQKLNDWCLQRDIQWNFNPPTASHFGGVWEREIRTIRKVLGALLREQPLVLTDEMLATLLCEVESILNSRPLTVLSDDPDDLEALTPNHLLLLGSGVNFPPGLFSKTDLYTRRRWRQVQYLTDLFWSRWKREYLPILQERQKWCRIRRSHSVGDLVLVIDQSAPRNQWCLGRITEVCESKDGQVRSAKIKVSRCRSGKASRMATTILERPISKLILIRPVEDL